MSNKGAAADIASQREKAQATLEQFLAQLTPGSEEYNQLLQQGGSLVQQVAGPQDEEAMIRDLATKLVQAQQQRIASGGAATPLEARTNIAFQGVRDASANTPIEQDVLKALGGQATTTPSGDIFRQSMQFSPEQEAILAALRGEVNDTPQGKIASQVVSGALNPDTQDLFPTVLKQLEAETGALFSRRGLAGSGLEIEQVGRAGVDAALAEAQRREGIRQQALSNYSTLLNQGQSATESRLSNTQNLFNAGEQLRGRQIGVEDAYTQLQQGRESNLTNLLANQSAAANSNINNLLARQTTREQQVQDAEAARAAAQQAAIGRALGTAAGTAAFFIPGVGPVVSAGINAATNASFPSGSTTSNTAAGQLAAQRANNPNPAGNLSQQATGSTFDINKLIKALQASGGLA